MSTRSNIGILNIDGTVTFIYCHFDGYPSGVGAMLRKWYKDTRAVNDLLDCGGISCLGYTAPSGKLKRVLSALCVDDRETILSETHTTIPYWLWRGENVPAETVPLVIFETDREDGAEYKYLFDPDTQKWKTYKM